MEIAQYKSTWSGRGCKLHAMGPAFAPHVVVFMHGKVQNNSPMESSNTTISWKDLEHITLEASITTQGLHGAWAMMISFRFLVAPHKGEPVPPVLTPANLRSGPILGTCCFC
jgi:hypothetical protein